LMPKFPFRAHGCMCSTTHFVTNTFNRIMIYVALKSQAFGCHRWCPGANSLFVGDPATTETTTRIGNGLVERDLRARPLQRTNPAICSRAHRTWLPKRSFPISDGKSAFCTDVLRGLRTAAVLRLAACSNAEHRCCTRGPTIKFFLALFPCQ